MKSSVKDSAPCEKLLSVSVSQDRIREEYDGFYQEAGKRARVPGFRPGKASREVLEVHFREEAKEKVLEKLISRSLREVLQEKQIEFLGRPTIRGVEFTDEKLTYEALLEVPPTIKLGKYRGLFAQRKEVKVTSEEVEKGLKEIQESLAKFVVVENRPSAMGDFLIADYSLWVEAREVEKRTDDWFELREEEFLKGFSNQLAGVRSGEEREVRVQFPEQFGRKDWAGRAGVFRMKVKEVKEKKLSPVDDELAKETGEFQTLEELRRHLGEQMKAEKTRQAEVEYEEALLAALLKENSFPLPKGVVERRLMHLAESAFKSLYQNGTPAQVLEKEGKPIYEKLRPEAEKQVKLSFLLETIAKKEKLELSDSDFQDKYQEWARRHRQSLAAVQKYYAEHPDAKESLEIQILNEKVIQLIKDSANPSLAGRK